MAGEPADRSAAIEGFVDRLTRLREDAGRPSFREMARRSGAISHATLHDALQGARMPSWETTVEFAKACGSDPGGLREDWERAAAVVRAESGECADAGNTAPEPEPSPEPVSAVEPESFPGPAPDVEPDSGRKGPLLIIAGAVAVLAVAAVIALVQMTRSGVSDAAGSSSTITGEAKDAYSSAPFAPSTTTSAQGCPENVDVPAGSRTLIEGDASTFVDDVTIPDCETQERGRSVVKTWSFENTGSVEWKNRFLHRINAHEGSPGCRAPERVGIPDTEPGETVQVSVTIATPDSRATCFARWMQTDEDGNFTFPEQRPYYYTFKVR